MAKEIGDKVHDVGAVLIYRSFCERRAQLSPVRILGCLRAPVRLAVLTSLFASSMKTRRQKRKSALPSRNVRLEGAASRTASGLQRFVPRLIVPDDLPQITLVHRLAASRTGVDMVASILRPVAMASADDRRPELRKLGHGQSNSPQR